MNPLAFLHLSAASKAAAAVQSPEAAPAQHEGFMSTASKYIFNPVEHFFGAVLALLGSTTAAPEVAAVQAKAQDLGAALVAAVPTVAVAVANAGLAQLGPIGTEVAPVADLVIQEACALLLAKHSNPAAGAAAVAAKLAQPEPAPAPTGA